MKLHRGRLIDHIRLTIHDFAVSKRFYRVVLDALAIPIDREGENWLLADDLMVIEGEDRCGPIHIALQAQTHRAVKACYEAAVVVPGAAPESPPGYGDVHPFYYSASVLDPDGNTVEFVCHGPVDRSAASVVIAPDTKALMDALLEG